MQILRTLPHLSTEQIKERIKQQKEFRSFQNWQIILSVQSNPGKTADEFASILNVNIYKVYRVIESYNKYGPGWDSNKKWGGRREARAYLTSEEEKEVLGNVRDAAINGQIITANDIRGTVEERVGHSVSDDYLWDLLNRHQWVKKAPRPTHPQGDENIREEFKKNSPKKWMPPN